MQKFKNQILTHLVAFFLSRNNTYHFTKEMRIEHNQAKLDRDNFKNLRKDTFECLRVVCIFFVILFISI